MGTCGFWGIIKKGEEKMIFNSFDSYPEGLGKEVLCLIQNNLECLDKIFEKIIFVKNIDNLDEDEAEFILISPGALLDSDSIEEKYFSYSAKSLFENGKLEYGYMIDLDKSILKLYDRKTLVDEINLDEIKFKDIKKAFK